MNEKTLSSVHIKCKHAGTMSKFGTIADGAFFLYPVEPKLNKVQKLHRKIKTVNNNGEEEAIGISLAQFDYLGIKIEPYEDVILVSQVNIEYSLV